MRDGDVLLCQVDNVIVTITADLTWKARALHQAAVSFNRNFNAALVTMLKNKSEEQRQSKMVLLSEKIASLGQNQYYDEIVDWYRELVHILSKNECHTEPLPDIHSDKGKGFIAFTGKEEGQVFFTWYKMPPGRFEIVCYRS